MRLALLLLLCIGLDASYIRWYSDYERAHKVALKEDKNLLILLVNKPSSELIKKSFINQAYIDEINREFIAVYVVKAQKSSYPLELLYTMEYPALFFLDEYELYSCEKISGILSPNIISKKLKECY